MRIDANSPLQSLPPSRVHELESKFERISVLDTGAFLALQNLVGQIEASLPSRGEGRRTSRLVRGMPTARHRLDRAARAIAAAVSLGAIDPPSSNAALDGLLSALETSGFASEGVPARMPMLTRNGAELRGMIEFLTGRGTPPAAAVCLPTSPAPSAEGSPRRVRVEVDKSSFLSPTGTLRSGGRVRVRVCCPGADPHDAAIARAQYNVLERLVQNVGRLDLGGGDGMRQLAGRTLASLARLRIRAQRYEVAGPGGIELLDLVEIIEVPTLQDRGTALRRFADDTRRQATAGDI